MSENEELFTTPIGEFTPEELIANPVNTMDITRKMFAIRRIRKEKEQIENQLNESTNFYKERMRKLELQEAFLSGNIDNWMARTGTEKLTTPAGTTIYRHLEKWNWTDDATILVWVKQNAPELIKLHEEQYVDKNELKKYLKEKQIVPEEILSVTSETKLEVRTY